MKYRCDFVTNSSSSSFIAYNINTVDGRTLNLCKEDESYFDESMIPTLSDGKIIGKYYDYNEEEEKEFEIKDVDEFVATLFFNGFDEEISIQKLNKLLLFLSKKITPGELIECLDGEFESINEIDIDEYEDEDELYNALKGAVGEIFEEYDIYDIEEEFDSFNELCDSVESLDEIESLDILTSEHNYGEFLNTYYDNLNGKLNEVEFVAINEETDEFSKEVDKWMKIVKEEIFCGDEPVGESIEALVTNALISGNPYNLIPCSMTSETKTTYKYK